MQVELVRANELGTSDWRHFEALFDTGSHPAHPMLHPDFASALAEVRDDTFVIFLKREAEVIGYWPVHLRPGRWMRAIGGPFSDVQGPILKPDIAVDLQEVLSKAGVRGITLPGLAHGNSLNPTGLRPRQVHLTRLELGWEAVLDEQTRQHKRFFKNHWRLDRKLRRDHDAVEFIFDDTRPESLRRLLDLKSQQFRASGHHDVIASAWAQDLIHRLYTQRDRGVSASSCDLRRCSSSHACCCHLSTGSTHLCRAPWRPPRHLSSFGSKQRHSALSSARAGAAVYAAGSSLILLGRRKRSGRHRKEKAPARGRGFPKGYASEPYS